MHRVIRLLAMVALLPMAACTASDPEPGDGFEGVGGGKSDNPYYPETFRALGYLNLDRASGSQRYDLGQLEQGTYLLDLVWSEDDPWLGSFGVTRTEERYDPSQCTTDPYETDKPLCPPGPAAAEVSVPIEVFASPYDEAGERLRLPALPETCFDQACEENEYVPEASYVGAFDTGVKLSEEVPVDLLRVRLHVLDNQRQPVSLAIETAE